MSQTQRRRLPTVPRTLISDMSKPTAQTFFSFMAHQKHIYDLMKFDSYPRFIRSEHYRRLVEMELTNNYVTENDVTQAYKKGFDTQEDKKRKKSAFKLLKNAVNPIVSIKYSGVRLSEDHLARTPLWAVKNRRPSGRGTPHYTGYFEYLISRIFQTENYYSEI